MSFKEKEITSKLIDKYLKAKGVFMIRAGSKTTPKKQNPNTFKVKELFLDYFNNYKILTYLQDNSWAAMTIYKP